MTFSFLPPAQRELAEAAAYYESREAHLGEEFIVEVHAAIRRIRSHPEAWTEIDPGVRRCRTNRFPYGIIYITDGDRMIIVSVMHLHRHPETWRKNFDE